MNLTLKDAAIISGLSARDIQFYSDRSVVKPYKAKGRGSPRIFVDSDIYILRVIAAAKQFGITIDIVREIVEQAKSEGCPSVVTFKRGDSEVILRLKGEAE
jgi:DNA-binding transcriptional MerR regulator